MTTRNLRITKADGWVAATVDTVEAKKISNASNEIIEIAIDTDIANLTGVKGHPFYPNEKDELSTFDSGDRYFIKSNSDITSTIVITG